MTTTEDPWGSLTPPTSATTSNMKPVDSDGPWDFYWMLDYERHRLLGLRHTQGVIAKKQLPNLRGISVEAVDFADSQFLIFKLLESAHREIFLRLCNDIIGCTTEVAEEGEAVAAALSRTWRWHYLLKGGRDRRLTSEQQKGLIGELRVLEDHILPATTAEKAVEMWTGPSGAPKDFEIGSVAIEAKARRGGAQPKVAISSEDQLDSGDFDRVFLHVINLSRPGPADEGFTVTDIVNRVRRYLQSTELAALGSFEERIAQIGYRDEDDYSDSLWMETGAELFDVRDGFPRIARRTIPAGVTRVRYEISLIDCQPFIVDDADLNSAIGGAIRER